MKPSPFPPLKTVIFSLIPLFLLLLAAEIGLRVYYGDRLYEPLALVQGVEELPYLLGGEVVPSAKARIVFKKSLFVDDPVLGFAMRPGHHELSILIGSLLNRKRWDFTANIGPDGYRVTGPDPTSGPARPELWIFGCSFTWGWPLNDDQSYPWILQQAHTALRVRNYAVPGYGTVHALIQLRELLARGGPRPALAVIVYNPFHLPRNVAAPSRLNQKDVFKGKVWHHPRASLDADGRLKIEVTLIEHSDAPDPPLKEQIKVTIAILREIKDLLDANGIRAVLAFQTGDSTDPVVRAAAAQGYYIVDMSVPLNRDHTVYPFDPHPNPEVHCLYARKLMDGLAALPEWNGTGAPR